MSGNENHVPNRPFPQDHSDLDKSLGEVLNSLSGALLVADTQERIIFMNRSAESLFGLRLREWNGQPVRELIDDADFYLHLDALAEGEKEVPFLDLKLKREEDRLFRARISSLQGANGRRAGIVLVLNDITREKAFDRAKSQFVATAAHELRTPLTAILGFAELLKDEKRLGPFSDEQREEFVTQILRTGERLSLIVNDLLDLGRLESGGPIHLERATWNLCELLEQAVQPFRRGGAKHHFEVTCPPEALMICGDRIRLLQAFDNLLSNAVKYSPKGGMVRVELTAADGEVRIIVTDQGIGMSPEQMARMFDIFYKADSSNTAISGFGIGMSIARGIIEAHQGSIQVQSTPGKGTRIIATLPLLDPQTVSPAEQAEVMTRMPENMRVVERRTSEDRRLWYCRRLEKLVAIIGELGRARNQEQIMSIVRSSVRQIVGADGATFILKEGDYSYYADEDAVAPLFKGKRFPLDQCIGGWSLLNRKPVAIANIDKDNRIPEGIYRDTFVKSLAIFPVRPENPLAAIGAYWAHTHPLPKEEAKLLEMLADAVSVAMEYVRRREKPVPDNGRPDCAVSDSGTRFDKK